MKIKIILNDGLKSCCSSYSSQQIKDIMSNWFKDRNEEIEVIDIKTDKWELDTVSSMAEQYFHEFIYPMVYADNVLISIGQIPDFNDLINIIEKPDLKGITKEQILTIIEKNK